MNNKPAFSRELRNSPLKLVLAVFVLSLVVFGFWLVTEFSGLEKEPTGMVSDLDENNNYSNLEVASTTNYVESNSDIVLPSMTDNNNSGEANYQPGLADDTRFSLDSMHALWGGHRMTITESGVVTVAYQDRGKPVVTATGQATAEELENLAKAFSQHGFSAIKDVPIKGYPDESSAVITERTEAGEVIKVSQSFNEQTTNFKAIHDELIKLADRVIKDAN